LSKFIVSDNMLCQVFKDVAMDELTLQSWFPVKLLFYYCCHCWRIKLYIKRNRVASDTFRLPVIFIRAWDLAWVCRVTWTLWHASLTRYTTEVFPLKSITHNSRCETNGHDVGVYIQCSLYRVCINQPWRSQVKFWTKLLSWANIVTPHDSSCTLHS